MSPDNPFTSMTPDRKLDNHELARAIRQDLAAEHEATNLYEAHADATNEPLAKKVLQNIADEEKVHAGEFNALLDVITGDEGKFQQQGEDEVVAAIDEVTPEMRAAVADYSPPTDATIIYRDHTFAGHRSRAFSAIPLDAPIPDKWHPVDDATADRYAAWLTQGRGGNGYCRALAWWRVAKDPRKEITRRQAEEERQAQRTASEIRYPEPFEYQQPAREKIITDRFASGEYGVTPQEIRRLRPGQEIEVAWRNHPVVITDIDDDDVYIAEREPLKLTTPLELPPGQEAPEFEYGQFREVPEFVEPEAIKRSSVLMLPAPAQAPQGKAHPVDLRPAQAKEPWQMTLREYDKSLGNIAADAEKYVPTMHRTEVVKAFFEGKPIPPEVLAEYPDLAQARGAKALPVWVEEFESVGGHMDPDGTVLLYHATTQDKAASILAEGVLRRPLDAPDSYGVYFSSSPSVSEDYGDGTIIPVRVQASDLHPDDVFPGRRMDFTVPTRGGAYRPVAVGDAALAQVRGARADGSPIVVRFGASERKYNHTIAAFERAGLPFYDYMADMGHYPWRYGLMNDTEEARELLKEQGGSIARSGSAPSLPRLEVLAWQYPKLAEGASRAVRIRPAALPPALGDIDMDEINAMVEDLHNEVSNMSAKLGAPDPITGGLKTWLASVGGLPGIVEDPNVAADSPCIAAELEEGESLIFSPGIIGALDEEQRQLYCQNGMERRELTEEQRARLSTLQDAARTCGAETGGLDADVQPFFSCLGRELRAKGEDVW